jgi:hypothetical protein
MAARAPLPEELFKKVNYTIVPVILKRENTIEVKGDWFAALTVDADLEKVYVGFNNEQLLIPLSIVANGVSSPFSKIYLRAEDSEIGKKLNLLIGHEFSFIISSQGISLVKDYVGLSRDSTLQALKEHFSEIMKNLGVTHLPSATRTVDGNTQDNPLAVDYGSAIVFFLNITSVSGINPSLDLYVDIQDPASGSWINQDKFDTKTTVGAWGLALPVRGNKYSVRWVLGGTNPSFTFSVGVVIVK